MAEVNWIKITTDIFEDEKIDYIESLPESDAIIVIWVKMLTLAGKCNALGYLFLTEKIPYDENMLAHKFKRPLNTVRLALATFQKLRMIEITENGYMISNWEKHQNSKGLEDIKEKNRIRQQKFRENQKLLPITKDIDIDKELDIDIEGNVTNNVTETVTILKPNELLIIEILEKVKDYPLDREKEIDMYSRLSERYPNLDIVSVIKEWSINKLDKPLKPKDSPRSQISKWCSNAVKWGQNTKEGVQAKKSNQVKPNTFKNFEERKYNGQSLEEKLLAVSSKEVI